MEKTAVNAQTLPRIAIGGMFIFAICLLLEGVFMKEKKELTITKASFHSAAFKKEMRSVLYCLFLVVYCFLVEPLGFVISTVILVAVSYTHLDVYKRQYLSSILKDLENELGIVIFRRDRRGVTLTEEGREFLYYARPMLEQEERIEALYSLSLIHI